MKAKNKPPIISIVLPAYNEARVIGTVLKSLPRNIKVSNTLYEIIPVVVNDGSTDNTAEIVLKQKGVYLINHVFNCGAGAATRTGLVYAQGIQCAAAVTMDADGQHEAGDVLKLAEAVIKNKGDLVIGSRLIGNGKMPWYRVLGNKGLSLITFLLFGVFVTDSQSGMKALNVRALQSISFHSDSYAFCSEMIWRAKQQGLQIKELPIKAIYTDYSLSKGQSNWGVIRIIQQLLTRRFLEFIYG